jgi:leucyl-tRNA synthetase
MRAAPTPAEAALWQALRRRQLGVRFSRQRPIFGYIADFYCFSKSLVVEVDGTIHDSRDEALYRQGFRTLRFSNDQVLFNLPAVLAVIRGYIL